MGRLVSEMEILHQLMTEAAHEWNRLGDFGLLPSLPIKRVRNNPEPVFGILPFQLTGGRPALASNCWKAGMGCRLLNAGSIAMLKVSSECRS